MVELSRRLFVFGSAAAIAAAAVPVIEAPSIIAPPLFTPVPALQPFLRRGIYDLMASFDENAGDGLASIELFRKDVCLFHHWINQRGVLRWIARPMHEIILMPDDTFKMQVHSEAGVGQLTMMCHDKIDDGPPVEVCERHTFPQRGPATIAYLHVDNSKEARIERAEARKRAAESWDDDDDLDDDLDDDPLY